MIDEDESPMAWLQKQEEVVEVIAKMTIFCFGQISPSVGMLKERQTVSYRAGLVFRYYI